MTGDVPDILGRIKAVLPAGWFPDTTPVLDAILSGCAAAWSWCYAQIQVVQSQTRLATASGVGLDLFAYDFFGTAFVREGRTDAQWRQVIGRELLRPRATRAALQSALTDLTGRAPRIFEPAQPGDTGAYAARGGRPFALAYGAAGGWGSLRYPYQAFVVAFRPAESGIPGVSGWGQGAGGYGVGAIEYASLDMSAGQVTDGQIMAEITKNIPIACTAWTRLSN